MSTEVPAELGGLAGWTVELMDRLGGVGAGLAIFLVVLSFNLLGDGLRDVLDPRQRTIIEARRGERRRDRVARALARHATPAPAATAPTEGNAR